MRSLHSCFPQQSVTYLRFEEQFQRLIEEWGISLCRRDVGSTKHIYLSGLAESQTDPQVSTEHLRRGQTLLQFPLSWMIYWRRWWFFTTTILVPLPSFTWKTIHHPFIFCRFLSPNVIYWSFGHFFLSVMIWVVIYLEQKTKMWKIVSKISFINSWFNSNLCSWTGQWKVITDISGFTSKQLV